MDGCAPFLCTAMAETETLFPNLTASNKDLSIIFSEFIFVLNAPIKLSATA